MGFIHYNMTLEEQLHNVQVRSTPQRAQRGTAAEGAGAARSWPSRRHSYTVAARLVVPQALQLTGAMPGW